MVFWGATIHPSMQPMPAEARTVVPTVRTVVSGVRTVVSTVTWGLPQARVATMAEERRVAEQPVPAEKKRPAPAALEAWQAPAAVPTWSMA